MKMHSQLTLRWGDCPRWVWPNQASSWKKTKERDWGMKAIWQEEVSPLLAVKMEGATWQGVVGDLDEPWAAPVNSQQEMGTWVPPILRNWIMSTVLNELGNRSFPRTIIWVNSSETWVSASYAPEQKIQPCYVCALACRMDSWLLSGVLSC